MYLKIASRKLTTAAVIAQIIGILFFQLNFDPLDKRVTSLTVRAGSNRSSNGLLMEIPVPKGCAVVLAGGTINTPKLLIQSGIGPKEQIQALGVIYTTS